MNAMAECCVGDQWPPLRLNVCKLLCAEWKINMILEAIEKLNSAA